jgi:hypothetical protein
MHIVMSAIERKERRKKNTNYIMKGKSENKTITIDPIDPFH